MRNLLRFILRHHFFLLFLLLELTAFILIFSNNPIQRGRLSGSVNSLSVRVYDVVYQVTGYLHLRQTNEQLARENAGLRASLSGVTPDTSSGFVRYRYIPAQVINNSVHLVNNYLTLNRGSEQGVEPDMGVVGPAGIVGIVKSVSRDYCRVLSVLNRELQISVKLSRSGYFGSMVWDTSDYRQITIKEIPSHASAEPGDTLVTSGYSSIFPEHIPVAVIQSKEVTKDGNFLILRARLINDFKKLSTVYVVQNPDLREIRELENEFND